jgi:hypothetical protein
MARRKDADAIKVFLDDLWKQAQGMLAGGERKARQAGHAARVKMDMFLLDARRESLLAQLGEAFYASSRRKNPSVRKRQKLFDLLAELRDVEAHGKDLRRALRKGAAAAPAKRRGRPPGRKRAHRKPGRKPAAAKGPAKASA